jgi:hypothetical protein
MKGVALGATERQTALPTFYHDRQRRLGAPPSKKDIDGAAGAPSINEIEWSRSGRAQAARRAEIQK